MVEYDPLQYKGSASHYLIGRPPYSTELPAALVGALSLDGSGHLLDVGCGPGVLAVELAELFADVTALDPDADMLEEAQRYAQASGRPNIRFVRGRAEDIPNIDLGSMRVVTFGQSFHRTDRVAVADAVYEILGPGGAMVLVVHDIEMGERPPATVDPPIPDDEVQALIDRYLGSERRSGQGPASHYATERLELTLQRTRFGGSTTIYAPGRPDITRDVDGVISGYLSMSYAAPHLFGDSLPKFVDDLRVVLERSTMTGRFSDWPGDTAIVIARRSA